MIFGVTATLSLCHSVHQLFKRKRDPVYLVIRDRGWMTPHTVLESEHVIFEYIIM